MNLLDLGILAVLALFTGIGALRGTMREMVSLGVWLASIGGGWLFADAVGTWFEQIQDDSLRQLVAFLVIVLVLLSVLSLAVFVLRVLLPSPSPDLVSRAFGGALGAVRGSMLVLIMVLLAGLTSLPRDGDWEESPLVGIFQPMAVTVLDWLPPAVARQFRYS